MTMNSDDFEDGVSRSKLPLLGKEGLRPSPRDDRAMPTIHPNGGEQGYGGEGECLTELMSAWVLSHGLFHVKVAPKKKVFDLYLQRLVLHIDDETAVPRKALTKFRLMA